MEAAAAVEVEMGMEVAEGATADGLRRRGLRSDCRRRAEQQRPLPAPSSRSLAWAHVSARGDWTAHGGTGCPWRPMLFLLSFLAAWRGFFEAVPYTDGAVFLNRKPAQLVRARGESFV